MEHTFESAAPVPNLTHRQVEQDQLLDRIERLELVLRATNEGLWDWNIETGEVYYSPRWKAMLGYADHEFPNSTDEWQQRVHPDDLDAALAAIRDYLRGDRATCENEHRLRHKDGSYRWIHTRGVAKRDADGTPVRLVGSHVDITDRKRSEEEVNRRDAILGAVRFAAERFLTSATTWEKGVQEVLERLGRATQVSRTYVFENFSTADGELLNALTHEWTAHDVTTRINDAHLKAISYTGLGLGRWMEMLAQGDMVYGHVRDLPETERLRAENEGALSYVLVPVFVDGEWWGVIGFDDIREERDFSAMERDALKAAADTLGAAIGRKRADEASAHLAAIVESSNDAIIGMQRNGMITSWNAAAQHLLGHPAAEMPGTSIHPLLPPEELTRLRNVLINLTNGGRADQFESEFIKQDGTGVAVSVTFSLVRNAEGDVTGTSMIARDIADRKRTEEELARRDAILETVRFAAERFLTSTTSWEENVQEVLERLARATGVSRTYVFENYAGDDGELWNAITHEWAAPGVVTWIDNPIYKAIPLQSIGLGRWMEVLGRGEMLYGHMRDLPDSERPKTEGDETLSFLSVPIFVDGTWWGAIGFDECRHERTFPAMERDALKAAADLLGAAIGRKRAEERLAWLAAIVESSDDAIIGRTLDDRIVSWNEGAERLYGYRADEVLGKSISMLLLADDADSSAMTQILEAVARGEPRHQYEGERRRKDGSRVSVSISFSPVRNRSGEVIGSAATTRDITKRKQSEAELRESQRSLSTLMANLPGMAYRHRAAPDWGMEFVSEGAFDLTGYAPHDLAEGGRVTYNDLVHPEDRPDLLAGIRAAVDRDEPFRVTYRISTASGAERWVMEQGRGVHDDRHQLEAIEGIVTDVTDRVRARHELEQRVEERTHELATVLNVSTSIASTLELSPLLRLILEQFRQVVDHVAAAIFLLDSNTDLRLLDYLGPMVLTELTWIWPSGEIEHSWEVIQSGKPIIIPDVRADTPLARSFQRKAKHDLGEVPSYISSWMGVPLIYRERVIGLLAVDGSEQDAYTPRDAEIALAFASQAAVAIENARLYEEAHGKAALEERQRLARELHDSVSQALFGIGLGARTARTLLDEDPARAAAPLDYVLTLAEAGLTEMRALIFELRPEALEQEGLAAALEKQVATLRTRHGISVTSTIDGDGGGPLDVEEAIYRIAQEAVHNIVKHAGATSVRLGFRRLPGRLELDIADDGAGFDPQVPVAGHLGLKTMRERAESFGGTLRIESVAGHGTRLQVEIPV